MGSVSEWKIGFKRHTGAWGDAGMVLGAGDGILITSEDMPTMVPASVEDANVGDSLAQGVVQGNREGQGSINMVARFEGIEKLLALYQGADAKTTSAGETAGTARDHSLIFQPSNTGKFGTLVEEKGAPKIWEYPTAKPNTIQLTHAEGKLMLAVGLIPNKCARDGDSPANANLDAATPTTRALMILFTQFTLLMEELTGSEGNLVDPTNKFCVTNFTFGGDRQLKGIPDSCFAGDVGEPQQDGGLPTANLTLNFADYLAANDVFIKAAQKRQPNGQPPLYKASLIWTGADIAGSDKVPKNKYLIQLDLPSIQVNDDPVNAKGPGARTSHDLTFKVVTPQTAINGSDWAWTVAGGAPFRFLVRNENNVAAA